MAHSKKKSRHYNSKIKHTKIKPINNLKEYDKLFPNLSAQNTDNIRAKALERAWNVRDFEIEMYWKRATYFWAFIASAFAAYIGIITSDSYPELKFLSFLIICLGILLSLAWILVNKSSKKWQSNWEGHIDRLEDNFTGPLYKVVSQNSSHSVSKINQVVSEIVFTIWVFLLIKEFVIPISNMLIVFTYSLLGQLIVSKLHYTLGYILLFIFSLKLCVYSITGGEDKAIEYKIRNSK